jgi:tetratricopeptide (TPR) repeat protein
MFFPRLRRRAKWVFAFLAVAFALAFVVAGVGSGFGSGIGDYLADIFNRQPGVDSNAAAAREEALADPRNDEKAERYREAIFQDDSLTVDEQIAEVNRYLELRSNDPDALQQLAGLYLQKASEAERRAQVAQIEGARAFFSNEILNPNSKLSQALGNDPITSFVRNEASTAYSAALAQAQQAYAQEADVWERVTQLQPDEPSAFFELGRASQQAGDTERAITALERFLELAPEAVEAAQVRQIVRQLKEQQAAQPAP